MVVLKYKGDIYEFLLTISKKKRNCNRYTNHKKVGKYMKKILSTCFCGLFVTLNFVSAAEASKRPVLSTLLSCATKTEQTRAPIAQIKIEPVPTITPIQTNNTGNVIEQEINKEFGTEHRNKCEEDCSHDFDCGESSLTLHKLCTHYLKALCGWIKNLKVCDTTTQNLDACHIKTKDLNACDINTNNLNACDIKTKDLQVTGNFLNCTKLKAWLSLATTYTYTLGDIVAFDTIYDPNGNVSGTPAKYIAPYDGWYLINVGYEAKNLVTPHPILGVPTADIVINIDGSITTTSDLATLGWVNRFCNKTMVITRLKAGAKVSVIVNLKAVAGITTSTNIPGTVQLSGSPDTHITYLALHYLSSDCGPTPVCSPCQPPCEACKPCTPCSNPCQPHPCPPTA